MQKIFQYVQKIIYKFKKTLFLVANMFNFWLNGIRMYKKSLFRDVPACHLH